MSDWGERRPTAMKDLLRDPVILQKLIPSKTVRENLGGWQPTDFDLAAVICHAPLTMAERETYLKVIAQDSSDEALKEQIQAFLQSQKRAIDLFAQNNDSIYVLHWQEESYAFFIDFQEAETAGRTLADPFSIEKYPLRLSEKRIIGALNPFFMPQLSENFLVKAEDGEAYALGTIDYDEKGRTLRRWMAPDADPEVDPKEAARREHDPALFQNAYVTLPNPFERGDIVTIVKNGGVDRFGVVTASQEDWRDFNEQIKKGLYVEFCDSVITVEFLSDQGSFSHSHISPFYLEKAEPEDQAAKELLLAGRELMLGRGSLERLSMAQGVYRKEKAAPAPDNVWSD